MAFTSPRTWVIGELAAAAQFNEQIRDNQVALKLQLDGLETMFAAVTLAQTIDLQVDPSGVANSGTTETTIFSSPVPADTWDEDERVVESIISGACSADNDDKVFRVYLGATELWDSGNTAINGGSFTLRVRIVRLGVGSQLATISAAWGNSAPITGVQSEVPNAAANEDETTGLTIDFTGQSSAGSDRIFGYMVHTMRAA